MSGTPLVTVLIPARNEEADIERCLRAVLAQNHPHDHMEIILVDGGSTDRTAQLAAGVLEQGDIDWTILHNAVGTTPSNLNAGLAEAAGEILCRVDARSIVPPEYVRCCAEVLSTRPDIAVTGGAQVAIAVDQSPRAVGIARALNNRYAMGGARYRAHAVSGPSDTVYLGAFRTADVLAAGGWDEVLLTNQDYELNRRMGSGGVVWFDGRLAVGYVPRQTLGALLRQYHRFGRWKVRYWRHTGDRPQRRQWMALAAVPLAGAAVLAVFVPRGRRMPRLVPLLAAAVVGVEEAERRGSAGPRGGPSTRAVGAVAMVAVATAWFTGVCRDLVIRRG